MNARPCSENHDARVTDSPFRHRMYSSALQGEPGFSLVELLIVVAISLVIAGLAIPNIANVVGNARLRGAASVLSGMFQSGRTLAIKQNRTMTIHFTTIGVGAYAYSKDASSSSTAMTSSDPQVQLGSPVIQVVNITSGSTSPAPLDSTTLGFTPLVYPDLPSFNARGLPCKYVSGVCANNGFVYYFTDIRAYSSWTAVSVSPAGRIKQWFWYGSSWGG